jgi:mono/diheme cytochrome c family protein
MRMWGAAFLIVLASCQQGPRQLTYEGADYKNAAEKVAHGKRLADILDCTGCHGGNLQGSQLADNQETGAMYAPNITLILPNYTDAGLERLIRHGEPKDGRQFWFMPVESYQFLSDADLRWSHT